MLDEHSQEINSKSEMKEATIPQRLNTRLRELYGVLQEKLALGPDPTIIEKASEAARERVDRMQDKLDIDQSILVQ